MDNLKLKSGLFSLALVCVSWGGCAVGHFNSLGNTYHFNLPKKKMLKFLSLFPGGEIRGWSPPYASPCDFSFGVLGSGRINRGTFVHLPIFSRMIVISTFHLTDVLSSAAF